jgi:PAS domain S-box-containing protein
MPAPDLQSKNELEIQMRKRIAELERANQELRAEILEYKLAEERYCILFNSIDEGFCIIEKVVTESEGLKDFRYIAVNPAFEKHTGLKNSLGKTIRDIIPEPGESIMEIYDRVALTGEPIRFEGYVASMSLWVDAYVFQIDDPKLCRVAVLFQNVTQRKRAEEALVKAYSNLEEKVKKRTSELENAYNSLKESEIILAEAQKLAHAGSYDWNIITDEEYWSGELYDIFGLDPKVDLNHNMFLKYIHPEDLNYVSHAINEALNGNPYHIDYRIILPDGKERVIYSQGGVIFDEKNTPIRMRGIVQDVTEQKLASKKLQQSEERYRVAAEQTGQIVFEFRIDTHETEWVGAIQEITGYDPEEFKSFGESFWVKHIHPEDRKRMIKSMNGFIRGLENVREEFRSRKKDGNYIYLGIHGVWLKDEEGRKSRAIGIIKDITERKQTEEFLANIETARQKEIHHRIKNNLQVISSLLDLQAEKFKHREDIKDSEVLEAFRESQSRVLSIAFIHEELYEGEETDKLDFSLYLQRLVENFFHTYRLGNVNISLKTDFEKNIFFNMDTAVPLGMIVNELISNSFKYAFPNRENGEIQIKLFTEEAKDEMRNKDITGKSTTYTLIVSDNGVGLPENIDIENSETLGLQLVNILVDQLDGKTELKRNNGTEFRITISI